MFNLISDTVDTARTARLRNGKCNFPIPEEIKTNKKKEETQIKIRNFCFQSFVRTRRRMLEEKK